VTTAVEVRLCGCGCGRPTKPAKATNTRFGHVKGQPLRFLMGHNAPRGRRGPYRTGPTSAEAPACDRSTLKGPVCRALDCRTPMHRSHTRRCAKGHPRHHAQGLCLNCSKRIQRGAPVELGPFEQQRMRPNEVLDEWEWLRGEVRWRDFPTRVGISSSNWEQLFARAARLGDPRAVRHPKDEPVRHWRAKDPANRRPEDEEKAS